MAIEAKEFTEKDELIANFYALRAGLSVIATETEKIRKEEKNLLSLKERNQAHRKKINDTVEHQRYNLEKDISDYRYKLKSCKAQLHSQQETLQKYQMPKAYEEFAHPIHPFIGFLLFCACFFAYIVVLAILLTVTNVGITGLSAFVILTAPPALVGFVFSIKKINKYRAMKYLIPAMNKCKEEIAHHEQKVQETERIISRLSNRMSRLDGEIKAAMNYDLYLPDVTQMEAQLNQEVIPACTKKAKTVTKALHKQFDTLLTEADWQNVDLLIFYLNTGRADSLKEALLLVDKQRQTDQLESAIRSAADHIVDTIRDSTYRLGAVITCSMARLSNQIKTYHSELLASTNRTADLLESMAGSINRLDDRMLELKGQGDALIGAETLNAALLRKANKSSDALMHELRYNQRFWVK